MPKRGHLLAAVVLLLAPLAALVGPRPDAAAFAYLQNGGFEDGATGWHAGSYDLVTVDASEVPPAAGSMSARLTANGSAFTVSQTIFDAPPGTYTASVSVRRTDPATQLQLLVEVAPAAGNNIEVYAPTGVADQWLTLSGQITLPAFSQVRFAVLGAGSGAVYIDDAHVDGAPPVTATSTATATEASLPTAAATLTGTRTVTPTRTASPTDVPTATPAVVALSATLDNGGFEQAGDDGAPASWHAYGGALTSASEAVHSGGRAARFDSTGGSTTWLYQAVRVEPGAPYAFGAWIDDGPDGGSSWLRISWYESDDASGRAIATSDSTSRLEAAASGYRYLTTDGVSAPDAAHSARLRVLLAAASTAGATIWVDDATFGPAELAAAPATAVPAAAATDETTPGGDAPPPVQAVLGATRRPAAQGRTVVASAAPSASKIVINEVLYDPGIAGANGDGEWVELYNAGDGAVDLGGWTLTDAAAADALPKARIEAHGYAIVTASDSFSKRYPSFSGTLVTVTGHIGNSLGNDGDRLALRDASGALADAISWGTDSTVLSPAIPDVPAGHSIERRTPGFDTGAASDFVDNEAPSPGAAFAAAVAVPRAKASAGAVEVTAASDRSAVGRWLPWVLSAASGAALLALGAWRALPLLGQRFRTRV
jgi:hypothetical protein